MKLMLSLAVVVCCFSATLAGPLDVVCQYINSYAQPWVDEVNAIGNPILLCGTYQGLQIADNILSCDPSLMDLMPDCPCNDDSDGETDDGDNPIVDEPPVVDSNSTDSTNSSTPVETSSQEPGQDPDVKSRTHTSTKHRGANHGTKSRAQSKKHPQSKNKENHQSKSKGNPQSKSKGNLQSKSKSNAHSKSKTNAQSKSKGPQSKQASHNNKSHQQKSKTNEKA